MLQANDRAHFGVAAGTQNVARVRKQPGDPNGPGLTQWPAFTEQNEQVMVYDATPNARPYPLLDRAKVLDLYFDRLRKAE